MKVSFDLTRQDYIEYNIFHHLNSKASRKSMQIIRFAIPVIYLLLAYPISKVSEIPFWWWATILTIISVVWVIKYPKSFKKTIAKRVGKMLDEGKNVGLLGNRTIEITDTAITSEGQAGEMKTNWEAVERICETEDYLFLYIASVQAYIIPKRAFENKEKEDDFIQTIKKYLQTDPSCVL